MYQSSAHAHYYTIITIFHVIFLPKGNNRKTSVNCKWATFRPGSQALRSGACFYLVPMLTNVGVHTRGKVQV